MSLVSFEALPDDARVWVFGISRQLGPGDESHVLHAVDDYLREWRAHGAPLTAARDWREGRFLAIGVDQRDEAASGCSLDALFRVFRGMEQKTGVAILDNSRVYFRDASGAIDAIDRAEFIAMAESGAISAETSVFDLSVQRVGEWRRRFETPVAQSWHRALLPAAG